MPTIGWDESKPADTDSAGLGDDEIRSLKTALRTGLDGEHVWPSASGDAGVHRLGSARAYYGTQSRVSSSGTDGRLMVTSDTSRLFHVGSTATSLMGGATMLSAASFPGTAPQRHYWAVEFGHGYTAGSVATTVSFPSSFSGVPFITATVATVNAPGVFYGLTIEGATTSDFDVSIWDIGGSLSANSFDWISIGTRVL